MLMDSAFPTMKKEKKRREREKSNKEKQAQFIAKFVTVEGRWSLNGEKEAK